MKNQHSVSPNSTVKKKARVILRPDGSVHIVFASNTSIRATARAVLELFRDPFYFIELGCTQYEESTNEICRKGNRLVLLEDVLGLDLAYITESRQIICNFPEIFACLIDEVGRAKGNTLLNLKDVICNPDKSSVYDGKAYLLRYYLEVSGFLAEKEMPKIEKDIKLQDEVKLAIIDVALRSAEYAPRKSPVQQPTVSDCIAQAEPPVVIETEVPEEQPDISESKQGPEGWMDTKKCGKILHLSAQQVRNWIREGKLVGVKINNTYFVDPNSLPTKNKTKKTRTKNEPLAGNYKEVQETILKNEYFTSAVAPYITNYDEMYLFAEAHREVFWDGRPALIIDIKPDFATKNGITNRERILSGNSPVSADSPNEEPFHLHHIGKKFTGPIAILSTEEHRELYASLHQAPADPEMDRVKFDVQRNSFWQTYLDEYDKAGFDAIPYLNKPINTNPHKK